MSSVTTSDEKQITRPLKVLVVLIKEDLKQGGEAAERAGMPFYEAAGAKMIESGLVGHELYGWTKRNFDIGRHQTLLYIKLAKSKGYGGEAIASPTKPFTSMDDFRRRQLGHDRPSSGRVAREWTAPVDEIAEKARRDALRLREADLTRQQEREAERVLALKLIDIGYKVLAKELHPDKGGSRETMQRLSRVRDRLKAGV